MQAAGALLDTLIGFSFGALVDPVTGNQSAVISQLYALVGVAVFIAIGGDAWVIQGLAPHLRRSSRSSTRRASARSVGGRRRSRSPAIFASALEVAAPVLLALIITDAAFGVVSRVVPQLNVFAVGFPAKIDRRPARSSAPRCRSSPAGSPTSSSRRVAAALHTLKVA